ncbi:MAG: RibD family protein, partial [Opitutales bacterium]
DGKFAAASGHSRWVTSELAREDVMLWRRYFPAIAVGANTVLEDNPSLTSRIGNEVFCPKRFIFDSQLKTAVSGSGLKLYSDPFKAETTVLCLKTAEQSRKEKILAMGVGLWELPDSGGHLDFEAFRQRCAQEGICGVYIECGPAMATALLEAHKADYVFIYKAAKFMVDSAARGIGSERQTTTMADAIQLKEVKHEIFGDDVLTRGTLAG